MSIITIDRLSKDNIFGYEFNPLSAENTIEFSENGIAVLYGPNGVGKSSLAAIMNDCPNSMLEGTLDGNPLQRGENSNFHVIEDQNNRNIIKGKTEDFILGDNIREERALKKQIDFEFESLKLSLIDNLRSIFKVKTKNNHLLKHINNVPFREFTVALANPQNKGRTIEINSFISTISDLNMIDLDEFDNAKNEFIISDLAKTDSIIKKLLDTTEEINRNEEIHIIEENVDAISILEKYHSKHQCIVCDNDDYDSETLGNIKRQSKQRIVASLDANTRRLYDDIIQKLKVDPFNIKSILIDMIATGDTTGFLSLLEEINSYIEFNIKRINNLFYEHFNDTNLENNCHEYNAMLDNALEITEEDMQFIQDIISDSLNGREIKLERDTFSNEIKILLGDEELIDTSREELPLSTGEQNFISLTFEFLKARHSEKEIIVLDDPISSFDSIYKNKIAFAILKFFENTQNVLILTHNMDLVRLLEVQFNNCFNLYIFNNARGGNNGFMNVGNNEKMLLLYLDKLLAFIRNPIRDYIQDEKAYLISMIPFMRGYSQLLGNDEIKNELTKVMHGTSTESIELTGIYKTLFNDDFEFSRECNVTVDMILQMNDEDEIEETSILNENDGNYPLLDLTLRHTLTYLFLRLSVEKTLTDTYPMGTRYDQLGKIISRALNSEGNKRRRIYLLSRKTLLNEFNHFEGNMNIFQPAIDICYSSLKSERERIIEILGEIRAVPEP